VKNSRSIPKTIPCVNCAQDVAVIVRPAVNGLIQYVGVKCGGCGMFLQCAGQSMNTEELAIDDALLSLRRSWHTAKKEISKIKEEAGERQDRETWAATEYAKRNRPHRRF